MTKPPLQFMAVLFLTVLTGYLFTLNPALFRNDSPETITGCVTLSITHPPGYPLFNLMGRAFHPFQVGNPAMTYNFMAALLGALGTCLLFANLWVLLPRETNPQLTSKTNNSISTNDHSPAEYLSPVDTRPDPTGLGRGIGNWANSAPDSFFSPKAIACSVASLCLAFSNGYWGNALAAKGGVYLFQMVLELALFLYLQTRFYIEKPQPNALYFFVFLFSLGLVNHWPSQLLLIPAFYLVIVLTGSNTHFQTPGLVKRALIRITFFLITLSLYIYLPLRSHLFPAFNFDAPYTFHRFIGAILRADYANEVMATHRDTFLPTLIQKSFYLSQHLSGLFHPLAYLFVLWGVFALIKTSKNLALFCVLFLFTTLAVNLFYLQVTSIELWHMEDHLLSANWVLALFLGVGLYACLTLPFVKNLRSAPAALVLVLVACTFFQNFSANDQKNEYLYWGYGMTALRSLPQDAIYFAESDYDLFSTLYLKTVLHKRPDIHWVPLLLLDKPYGRELVAHSDPALLPVNPTGRPLLVDLVQTNAKTRPLYCTFNSVGFANLFLKTFGRMPFEPSGLLTHLIVGNPKTYSATNHAQLQLFWDRYLVPEVIDPSPTQGLLRQACASPFLSAAQYERLKGQMVYWDLYYNKAVRLIADPVWLAQTWMDKAAGDVAMGEKAEARKAPRARPQAEP